MKRSECVEGLHDYRASNQKESLHRRAYLGRGAFLFCSMLMLLSFRLPAQELPVGTILEARLDVATGSGISHVGDQIEATTIAPVSIRGQILVPQGSTLFGSIDRVNRLALGLKNTTATIHYFFHTLRLTNGEAIPIQAKVVEVETAKELVDATGTVRGILPIASLSSTLNFYAVPLLCVTPTVGAPVWAIKSLVAPSANPEIYFPVGAEVVLRLTASVRIEFENKVPLGIASFSPEEMAQIHRLLKGSARRARIGSRPSDMVNLLFLCQPYADGPSISCRRMVAGGTEVADVTLSDVPCPY